MESLMNFLRESLAKVTQLPADNFLSLKLCKKLFIYIGLWPPESKPKKIVAVARWCLLQFLLFRNLYCEFIGLPLLAYHTIDTDIQRSLTAIASDFVIFMLSAAYSTLLSQRQQIDRMFRAMEAMNICGAKLSGRHYDVVEGSDRWALLPLTYLIVCLFMIGVGCFDLIGVYAKREFAYELWYPFDEKVFPTYQIVFLLVAISHNYGLVCMLALSVMFMSLMLEAIGNFKLLSHNFRNIVGIGRVLTVQSSDCSSPLQNATNSTNSNQTTKPIASHRTKLPIVKLFLDIERVSPLQSLAKDTQDKAQPASNPCPNTATTEGFPVQKKAVRRAESPVVQPKEGIEEALKTCVLHHYAIMSFVDEVAVLFDKYLFQYLLCTLVPNSVAIVLILYAKELDEKTKTVLMLLMGSNLGVAIICWLADDLTKESEGVRDAVYGCDWFGQSESFKRSMRIIMSQCNQPVAIKVAGFITLSMETFFEISKLTYSYTTAVFTQYQDAAM